MNSERIVAIALLTRSDLASFGSTLKRVIPTPDDDAFKELLQRLDKAERKPKGRK